MLKRLIQEWLPWILILITMIVIALVVTGCGLYNPDITKEGITYAEGAKREKPAKNKPVFVTRAYYLTEEDFQKALCIKIAWLEGKGKEIILIKPVYGKDVKQMEIIKYYIVYYREVKK